VENAGVKCNPDSTSTYTTESLCCCEGLDINVPCTDMQYVSGLYVQLKIMTILRTLRKFMDSWQP